MFHNFFVIEHLDLNNLNFQRKLITQHDIKALINQTSEVQTLLHLYYKSVYLSARLFQYLATLSLSILVLGVL